MISLTIWFCLWSSFFVLAPPLPSLLNNNQHQSLENLTFITSHLSNTNSEMLIKRQKIKINRTTTTINYHQFDINSYRSSWKFVDKNTMRIRFRLDESLLLSIVSTRFIVRHIHTSHIQTYDEPHEIINSTITLYLHNIKHGRHTVCLLLYRTKLMINPKYIFCQDIIFNFHKYGQHDTDTDEHKNTIFFLLTQYAIVLGILCILELVYTARKRRFLRTVYNKANALRQYIIENHYHHHNLQDNKSTTDLNHPTHTLEYLIYNLNRNTLDNFDQMYMQTTNQDNLIISDYQKTDYEKHLKLPNQLNKHTTMPLLGHHRSITTDVNFDLNEDDFDTRSYEEQSISYKSISHILETNKPWMTKLTNDGNIEHSILSSVPLQSTRVHSL